MSPKMCCGEPALNFPFREMEQNVFAALLTLALAVVSMAATATPSASAPKVTEGRKLPLKEQLTLGLKATTKEDKDFIDRVVTKVEEGVLPRPLVDSTFLWARERARRKSASRSLRPMVYFRPGLIARAKFLKIPF